MVCVDYLGMWSVLRAALALDLTGEAMVCDYAGIQLQCGELSNSQTMRGVTKVRMRA